MGEEEIAHGAFDRGKVMTEGEWRYQDTDNGILAFDRISGLNVLQPETGSKRSAPRVLQIGLLTTLQSEMPVLLPGSSRPK